MPRFFRILVCLTGLIVAGIPWARGGEVGDGWVLANHGDNLTVYLRPHEGSSIREWKVVGIVDAEPIVLKRVLDDFGEYPKFMPYVIETKIITRTGDECVGYQRASPPIGSDRDYTVRLKCESSPCATGGIAYRTSWEAANDRGPAEIKGVIRVKITHGSWLLEPAGHGKTHITYTSYTDSGSVVPIFLLKSVSKFAFPKLFDAIRKQTNLSKYQSRENGAEE